MLVRSSNNTSSMLGTRKKNKKWAVVYETRENLQQFLFANCLSPAISSQFIFGVCAAAENRKNQF